MRITLLLVIASLILLVGCGCDEPLLEGSPFGYTGTATIEGTATIPASVGEDLQPQFLVQKAGELGRIGVIPDNLFSSQPSTCGSTLRFTITKVEAGDYDLFLEVTDPDNEFETVYEGQADTMVTVADGETVTVSLVFP